jgi:predicted transcriptional regulator
LQVFKKFIIVLGITVFLLIFSSNNVFADTSIKPSFDTIEITIAVVVAAIAFILSFIFFGGIKYVTPENVLNTEIRKNLYNYIDNFPGSHLREIARELDLKPSNAAWHLRKLEQTNLVRSRTIGGKKVFYLVEGGAEARIEAIAESILKNKNARDIMFFLKNNPGKHLLEISSALELNHHTVKWHIKKMYLAELIDGDTSNSAYPVYYPTDVGIQALYNFSNHEKRLKTAS